MLTDWANSVAEYLKDQAKKGTEVPGYKLVAGTSQRKITDEKGLREKLHQLGYEDDQFEKTQLAGIPAIEKLVGKDVFNKVLSDFWVKPEGTPILVPREDPRPELGSAESASKDFS